jgi:hypothetical protein
MKAKKRRRYFPRFHQWVDPMSANLPTAWTILQTVNWIRKHCAV